MLFNDSRFKEITEIKFKLVSDLLDKNFNVFYVDGDIYILKDLAQFIEQFERQNTDIVIQNDNQAQPKQNTQVLCTGLFAVKSNANTKKLFNIAKFILFINTISSLCLVMLLIWRVIQVVAPPIYGDKK